jgi:hypothetical protein
VSNFPPWVAAMMAPTLGWEVRPDMASVAQSTTSAPAAAATSMVATPVPAVSCVCTWMGRLGNSSRSAEMSMSAARGFSRPVMSLMASTSIPAPTIFSASSR